MNFFLNGVGITFRRDPETGRPRVNKKDSWLDRYQKEIGEYYYTDITQDDKPGNKPTGSNSTNAKP
jgi:hypothetical protein